ncbi:MAG: hypothetical protein EOP83_12995 [Verrucomicrobiaceae bacterium]|nr:MAG: hypothetical protein EOP83_12995 [Verrucomicrobiaceae bacterium]
MSAFEQNLVVVPHIQLGLSEPLYMFHGLSRGGVDPALIAWFEERGRTLQMQVNREAGIHLKGLAFYLWLDDPIYEKAAIELRMAWNVELYRDGYKLVCP